MRTFVTFIALAAVALAVVAGANAGNGKGPAPKVAVCHLNGSADQGVLTGGAGNVFFFGRVIMVSENAVPALLAHGDATQDPVIAAGGFTSPYDFITAETVRNSDGAHPWELLMSGATAAGVNVGNANCAFRHVVS